MDEQTFRGCYQALAGTRDVDADAIEDRRLAAIPATRAELEEVAAFLRPLRHAFRQPGVDEQQARQHFVEPYWLFYSTGRPQGGSNTIGFPYPPTRPTSQCASRGRATARPGSCTSARRAGASP